MMRVLMVLPALILFVGCSSKLPPLPTFSEVKGTIVLPDGSPLQIARLEFHVTSGADTEPFGDVVDGNFSVIGAIPGKYKVSVSLLNYRDRSGSAVKVVNSAVNPRYTNSASTPLEVEIQPGVNILTLKLEP
jgi:hypothetical protein